MNETVDIFEKFATKCPICLMGSPKMIDDTDNKNMVVISIHPVFAYQCDTCGWKCDGYVRKGEWMKILDERWNEQSKIRIASIRYNLGVSIITNRLSAWESYFINQMVA